MTKPIFKIKEATINYIDPKLGRYSDGLQTYEVTFITDTHDRMFGIRTDDGAMFEAYITDGLTEENIIQLRVTKKGGGVLFQKFHSGRFAGFVAKGSRFNREEKVGHRPVVAGDTIFNLAKERRKVLFVCPTDNALVLSGDDDRSFIVSPTRAGADELFINVIVEYV
ncbi:MAG: hypothetical protein ACRC9Y_07270 [Aeromonas veronii]